MERLKCSEGKQHQSESSRFLLCITKRKLKLVLVHAPTTSLGKRTNRMETARGKFGLELKNEREDTLVEWVSSRKYKIMNTMFQKKAGTRWTWESPNGVTKTAIDYILTNRPDIVIDVTVISQVNIGSDHKLVMSNIKLDVEVDRKN